MIGTNVKLFIMSFFVCGSAFATSILDCRDSKGQLLFFGVLGNERVQDQENGLKRIGGISYIGRQKTRYSYDRAVSDVYHNMGLNKCFGNFFIVFEQKSETVDLSCASVRMLKVQDVREDPIETLNQKRILESLYEFPNCAIVVDEPTFEKL